MRGGERHKVLQKEKKVGRDGDSFTVEKRTTKKAGSEEAKDGSERKKAASALMHDPVQRKSKKCKEVLKAEAKLITG